MKKINEVIETEEVKEVISNEWLSFDEVVETKDCKVCNGSGWVEVNVIDDRKGVARVRDKAVYIEEKYIEEFQKENMVRVYKTDKSAYLDFMEDKEDKYFYFKEITEQQCECVLKANARQRFKTQIENSGLEEQLKTKTFKTYIVSDKWQYNLFTKCKRFVNEPTSLLALLGQTGAGKTHLGTATVGNLVYKGYNALYVEWKKEMNLAKDDYYKVKSEKLELWRDVDVLYIDDLFKNKQNDINLVTDKEFDIAWEILDSRLTRNKITIISSEFTINDFTKLDEGTGSRIVKMAGEYLLETPKDTKKNYRLKGKV